MSETVDYQILFDSENNRIIIPMNYVNDVDDKIYVPIQLIREVMPMPEKMGDKLEWLDQILHEIRKDKLINLKTYLLEVSRLAKGQEEIRKEADKIKSKLDLEILKIKAKTWIDEKNIFKEARLAFRLLKFEEQKIELLRTKVLSGDA